MQATPTYTDTPKQLHRHPDPLPKLWPKDVTYTCVSVFEEDEGIPGDPISLLRLQEIEDPNHPCFQQLGCFAAQDIEEGTWICEYTGEITEPNECNDSNYIMPINSIDGFIAFVDAQNMGCHSRKR